MSKTAPALSFKEARAAALERHPDANVREALAIAHAESERVRESAPELYFAWNKVIHQLWAIEQAMGRGQSV
jgi:hypothetical protein